MIPESPPIFKISSQNMNRLRRNLDWMFSDKRSASFLVRVNEEGLKEKIVGSFKTP